MDITPTREYLDDLSDRLKRLADGENEPIGMGDLLTLLMALKTAIAIWRPGTLEELIDAAAQQRQPADPPPGPDAWAPILKAYPELTPRGLARAIRDRSNPIGRKFFQYDTLFHAVMEEFDLGDAFRLDEEEV